MSLSSAQLRLLGGSKAVSNNSALPDVKTLSDAELASYISELIGEQKERAIASVDPDAMLNYIFTNLFTPQGYAQYPEILNGVLLCPGHKLNQALGAHKCSFVIIDDKWVWEHPDIIADDVREAPKGGDKSVHTASLVPAVEGMRVVYNPCVSRQGSCKAVKTQTKYFIVEEGGLVPAPAFSYRTVGHRD